MSETLAAAAVSDVSAVCYRNQLTEQQCVNLSPILSLSQEGRHIMRDVHLRSHSQVSKQYTFYNVTVSFYYRLFVIENIQASQTFIRLVVNSFLQ